MKMIVMPAGAQLFGSLPKRVYVSVFTVMRSLHGWITPRWADDSPGAARFRRTLIETTAALATLPSTKTLLVPALWLEALGDSDDLVIKHAHAICLDAPFLEGDGSRAWEAAPLSTYVATAEHLRALTAAFRIPEIEHKAL